MIDKQYIESARNIRSEFLSLNKKLEVYKKELVDLSDYLQNVIKDLETMSDKKIDSKQDLKGVAETLIEKIGNIELEEQKLTKLVKPINDRIEKLREEENILYNTLKKKYPNLTDEDLKTEIYSHLK